MRRKSFIKRVPKRIPKSLLKKADTAFSLKIRARDKHCQFPGCISTTKLQCSHYFGRANKSTRFDEDNCIALCWFHHYGSKLLGFEYQKQREEEQGYDGRYTLFMICKFAGTDKWKNLKKRAQLKLKLTRDYLQELIEELKPKP